MNTVIFKMSFHTPVHFGKGRLGDSHYTFDNHRLFSALFIELMKSGIEKAERFLEKCKLNKIAFSDAFPFIGERYYLPRPHLHVTIQGDRTSIKAMKNLTYIPSDKFSAYLAGTIDPLRENKLFQNLGEPYVQQRVGILKGQDNLPYFVGAFSFFVHAGLYFFFSYEDEDDLIKFDDLMTVLGESGIGGKRTSGFGRFKIHYTDLKELGNISKRIGKDGPSQMTLGFSFPEETAEKIIDEGSFSLSRKSGYVLSETAQTPYKKKRIFGIASGSVFPKRYQGEILDVSRTDEHPVYLYAKPLWMEVSRE